MAQADELVASPHSPQVLLRFLSQLGHVLLSTGETVAVVENTVRRVAVAHGAERVSVVALPTAIFVTFQKGDDTTHLDFTAHKGLDLRFDQIEAVFAVSADAERPVFGPAEGLERLEAILARPARYGAAWSIAGHVLVTVGIALVLQPTPGVVASATGFGLVVGALKVFAARRGMLAMLLPTVAAFIVAALSLMAVRHGFPESPLGVLIASLITFVPGGALAIATMELAYGDMVSGASRFVAGLLQLVFLILGMIIATSLVGLPPARLLVQAPDARLGAWAPWLGVVLFAVGHVLHYSARLGTLPWLLVALCVAQAGQAAGSAAFGGYMGGFVGALVVTPFAYFSQYRLGGPPAMVVFQPALWLLLPGSLGVVGLAELAGDDHLAGIEDFVTAMFSIVAIAFGALIGSSLYDSFVDPIFRRTGSLVASMWRLPWPGGRRERQ